MGGVIPVHFLFAAVYLDPCLAPLRIAIDLDPLDAEPATEGFPAGLLILFQILVEIEGLAAIIAVNTLTLSRVNSRPALTMMDLAGRQTMMGIMAA